MLHSACTVDHSKNYYNCVMWPNQEKKKWGEKAIKPVHPIIRNQKSCVRKNNPMRQKFMLIPAERRWLYHLQHPDTSTATQRWTLLTNRHRVESAVKLRRLLLSLLSMKDTQGIIFLFLLFRRKDAHSLEIQRASLNGTEWEVQLNKSHP